MVSFRAGELSQWVSRLWKNGFPEEEFTGVSHDTRTLRPGHLYVALRGERFDGHDFLEDAFDQGAVGALVSEDCSWADHPVLPVTDTLTGLQDLARGYRKKWGGTVVGITGSVGKTTVKEMCASVLERAGITHRTAGNYNNHIGLPLTMLRMPLEARYGVFEIGMNQPGEIGPLSDLLQPKVGILTDIGGVHLENFESVEAIAREKARLVEQVAPSGFVILDRDSPWYSVLCSRVVAEVVTVSLGGMADYAGRRVGENLLEVNGYCFTMPLPGEHVMRNALRAIALGAELGLSFKDVDEGLQAFRLPPMRWACSSVGGLEVINDAYNANPLSMRAALDTFAAQPCSGEKWVVIGGMHELGAAGDEAHAELGRYIDELPVDGVVVVGEMARGVVCQAPRPCHACTTVEEAAELLRTRLSPGDAVLLKASRSERLERILDLLGENE